MDQYFACDFDMLLSKLLVRLEPQQTGGVQFSSQHQYYINLIAFVVKLVVSLVMLLFKPEWSGFYISLQYLALFLKFGGFENIGISLGFAIRYALEYEVPNTYVPLKPFDSWSYHEETK